MANGAVCLCYIVNIGVLSKGIFRVDLFTFSKFVNMIHCIESLGNSFFFNLFNISDPSTMYITHLLYTSYTCSKEVALIL